MEKYFNYVLELTNYVLKREQDLINIREDLKACRKELNDNIADLSLENAKLSKLLLSEEEKKEKTKYKAIPIFILIGYVLILMFLGFNNLFNLNQLLFIFPIAITFPLFKKISERVEIKYDNLREVRQSLIEEQENKRNKLQEKNKDLKMEVEYLETLLKEIETETFKKREYLNKLRESLITRLAPTLDRLIAEEITKNNNTELQEELKRIREI